MRNLKKILALVLALVMSLSLMATASAAETETAETGSKYQTAINVLKGLEVVKGDEKGDRPTDNITRAEVAALLYRISTADVKDAEASIHTGVSFTDVNIGDWYTGYISYCYIAQIVKGNPNGTFDPNDPINGYATLAMILRAMGYGKNGEFEGNGWEIQTASTAKRIGILDGISDTQLSGPATRELVFEILFRAMLKDEVKFDAREPYQYPSVGTTLGGRNFGLEKITGVVMANEWANLNEYDDSDDGDYVLADGTTEMKLADGTTRTLAASTDLDAVGMTYDAYIAGKGNTKDALTLTPNPINVVAFNEGKSVNTGLGDEGFGSMAKLAATEGLRINKAEYFDDYTKYWNIDRVSDYLIRYRVTLADETNSGPATQGVYTLDVTNAVYNYLVTDGSEIRVDYPEMTKGYYLDENTTGAAGNGWGYAQAAGDATHEQKPLVAIRTIKPGDTITDMDVAIMRDIFYSADRYKENPAAGVEGYIEGEVYVGTSSLEDKSDSLSWKEFYKQYIEDTADNWQYTSCGNGTSIRIIDNNGDGEAEYVLRVNYGMDQAIDTYKDVLQFNRLNLKASDVEEITYVDEIAVSDVIIWSYIDGRVTIWKAETDTDKIQTKSFKNITVTTEGGETYGQSDIINATGMDQLIMNMLDKTEYIMYKDLFGFVRAYEVAGGTQYALLTEMYPTGTQNWNYIKTVGAMVELKAGDEAIDEFVVAGGSDNLFFNQYPWTSRTLYNSANYNYLQPAIAHLGLVKNQNVGSTLNPAYIEWGRSVYAPFVDAAGSIGVFDYGQVAYGAPTATTGPVALPNGTAGTAAHSFSFTNVAIYTTNEDGSVNLGTAAKLAKTQDGEQIYYYTSDIGAKVSKTYKSAWIAAGGTDATFNAAVSAGTLTPVYAVDYVQLDAQAVKAGTRHYAINANYETEYQASANGYVDATVNTEYYIVDATGATHYVGYDNIPAIAAKDVRATYAVAKNTSYAEDGRDYWVADVIVIEVNGYVSNYQSISLMYYNPWETANSVRYVNSLNNNWTVLQPDYDDQAKMDVVPSGSGIQYTWGATSWDATDYGFYKLFNTELETEGTLKAGSVEQIVKDWAKYGIYAGTVQRIKGILNSSGYIDVDTYGRTYNGTSISDSWVEHLTVRNIPIYRVTRTSAGTLTISEIDSYNEVNLGDELIWVYAQGSTSKLSYIVDLGSRKNYSPEQWLWDTYVDIRDEQRTAGLSDLEVVLGTVTGETLAVSNVKSNLGAGSATGTNPVTLVVKEGSTTVKFTVTPSAGINPDDLIVTPATGWNLWDRQPNAAGDAIEVTIIKISQIESLNAEVARIAGANTVMTPSYFTTVVLADIAKLVVDYNAADQAGKDALADDMNTAKAILAQSKAGTGSAAVKAAIAEAEAEISYALGEEERPVTAEDAGKTLVEKYNTWALTSGAATAPAKKAALNDLIAAAIAYKEVAGAAPAAGDAKTAYDQAVTSINALVKTAADSLDAALVTTAAATTLGAIKTALTNIAAVDELPAGSLGLATWSNSATSSSGTVTQAQYTEKAAAVKAKADLLTIATTLVTTYKAYDYAKNTASPAPTQSELNKLFNAFKAAVEAVDALPELAKNIVSTSTLTGLDTNNTSATPAAAYTAYQGILLAQPVNASNVGLVADTGLPGAYDPATKTATVAPGTTISAANVLGWFKATADAVYGNNLDNEGTKVANQALVAGSCALVDNTTDQFKFTFPGINGGDPAYFTITVVEATNEDAVKHDLALAVTAAKTVTTVSEKLANCTEDAVAGKIEDAIETAIAAISGDYGSTITVESCTLVVEGDWTAVPTNGSRTVTAEVVLKAVKGSGTAEKSATETVTLSVRYTNPA